MSYVIYHKETTRMLKQNQYYKTQGAAKAALTRAAKANRDLVADDYAIADTNLFFDFVEKTVVKKNLMSGKDYEERANTPSSCSPASETYWSM